MTKYRTRAAIACVALLFAAACSESVDDGGGGNGNGGSSDNGGGEETRTTRGVTDDSIKVGGIHYSGFFGQAGLGVEARLEKANAEGGVHGRTIEFVGVEDDANVASNGLEIAQRLVEQEQVFALLPVMSGAFGGGDYVKDNQIPMFGWGTHPSFCDSDSAFGVTGCVTHPSLEVGSNALGTALLEHFGSVDGRTVAFLGDDNDAGRGGIALLKASVEDLGFEVVMDSASLPAPPDALGDPSPFVAELLSADGGDEPDIIYVLGTSNPVQIPAALQGAGYEGMIVLPSYSPLLLGANGYDGIWLNTQVSMDPEVPANAEMLAAVAEVDPDATFDLSVAVGYWAADFFIKGLEETGEDLTVENFLATLNSGDFTYEVEDVVGPSEWPEMHGYPVPCSALTETRDGAFVPTIPLACGENIDVE